MTAGFDVDLRRLPSLAWGRRRVRLDRRQRRAGREHF
jgi:hypothetical protein